MGKKRRFRPSLCENAGTDLNSALLRKICERLASERILRRREKFSLLLSATSARRRFHTAWTRNGHRETSVLDPERTHAPRLVMLLLKWERKPAVGNPPHRSRKSLMTGSVNGTS